MNNRDIYEGNFKMFYDAGIKYIEYNNIEGAIVSLKKALECTLKLMECTEGEKKAMYHEKGMTVAKIIEKLENKKKEIASVKKPSISNQNENEKGKEKEEEKPAPEKKETIRFSDVAGLKDVKDQIIFHVLEPLKNPDLAKMYGISPGGKILLYGPPGTGKTFIARAIAGEVDAEFYSVNCQDLISKYMGESSQRLDQLFNEAQKNQRAIIFFDEFDSIASKRSDETKGVDAEMSRFVATFLTKVDGFKRQEEGKMLLLIAATNRPWALDSAMVRGGRFDTHIYVGVPDTEARTFMVKKAMEGSPMDKDADISIIVDALEGYGGGDIIAACDKIRLEAYKKAVQTGVRHNITEEDFTSVISTLRNHITNEELEKFTAYREGRNIGS